MIKRPEEVRYTVIGAGNGGLAMAGYLGLMGFTVNLYNRSEEKIRELIKDPKIHLTGAVEGEGRLSVVTTDIREAIDGSDIIMVTTPATAHRELAEQMAPYIKDDQIIVLNPGRTCGALEVYETLRKSGCTKNVIVAEAQTFIYACRATGPSSAKIFSVKNEVKLSAIPAKKTWMVIRLLSAAYPQFKPARDVMETSLNNFGAIFHPAPTLLNSGHIERGQTFEYYLEGITPSIGQMLEKLDAERMKVARALGVKAISAMQWLEDSYGARGNSIYEAIQNNPAYKGLTAPKDLKTRYIYEDVPFSLVPISSLAKNLGIETPAIDTIIRLANMMTGVNFWEQGRTVDKLGLAGLSPAEIHEFAQNGYLEIKRTEEEVVA
ncbi:NAD/NADP-dependent octopine/nopaline dehydrogenase family protein [Thermosediminibacter oceani]|uniref:NAD/NADP octopine/nopaline dehydrogenase n=1 Tax=Thermosediminibacter oceani (strain ATCC BAA-1034 / DSM 16646 / JW/IW-1228P) TaxID=555079 RepID=D9S089_THEOJ|nr:NAD/NADP-dependent octopine/nopaline dehydrogenase family protein [Thermosediminibacter oceani]ADL07017.1 NAD/NADP octopine/nopaline dehydrogenase [Thermosediminibacter oceani DSM 16646]